MAFLCHPRDREVENLWGNATATENKEKIHTARRDCDNAINCSTGYLSNISYLMKTHVKKKHEQTYYTNAEETDRNLRSSQMQTAVKQNSISYGWFIPKKKLILSDFGEIIVHD